MTATRLFFYFCFITTVMKFREDERLYCHNIYQLASAQKPLWLKVEPPKRRPMSLMNE